MPNVTNWQQVYHELGATVAAMPQLTALNGAGQMPDVIITWLAELEAQIAQMGTAAGISGPELNLEIANLIAFKGRATYATKIKLIAHRCLAIARSRAPAGARSAFVSTGADFDAFSTLSEIFKSAKDCLLIVDPYLDGGALIKFAPLAMEKVNIAFLADAKGVKPDTAPAAASWISQFGAIRPISVRLAPEKSLHDRAILVDNAEAWILTQSLKDFAARSPAMVQRVDSDLALMKFAAYSQIWKAAHVVAETP